MCPCFIDVPACGTALKALISPQSHFDTGVQQMSKPKIGVIISSTRPTRFGEKPAKWIL